MIANDIDVFYEKFGFKDVPLIMDKNQIKKFETAGFYLEINKVKCPSLSADGFTSNDDINLIATFFDVDFSKDDCLQIHAAPRLWQFAFDKAKNQTIKVTNFFDYSIDGATMYVCLLVKTF